MPPRAMATRRLPALKREPCPKPIPALKRRAPEPDAQPLPAGLPLVPAEPQGPPLAIPTDVWAHAILPLLGNKDLAELATVSQAAREAVQETRAVMARGIDAAATEPNLLQPLRPRVGNWMTACIDSVVQDHVEDCKHRVVRTVPPFPRSGPGAQGRPLTVEYRDAVEFLQDMARLASRDDASLFSPPVAFKGATCVVGFGLEYSSHSGRRPWPLFPAPDDADPRRVSWDAVDPAHPLPPHAATAQLLYRARPVPRRSARRAQKKPRPVLELGLAAVARTVFPDRREVVECICAPFARAVSPRGPGEARLDTVGYDDCTPDGQLRAGLGALAGFTLVRIELRLAERQGLLSVPHREGELVLVEWPTLSSATRELEVVVPGDRFPQRLTANGPLCGLNVSAQGLSAAFPNLERVALAGVFVRGLEGLRGVKSLTLISCALYETVPDWDPAALVLEDPCRTALHLEDTFVFGEGLASTRLPVPGSLLPSVANVFRLPKAGWWGAFLGRLRARGGRVVAPQGVLSVDGAVFQRSQQHTADLVRAGAARDLARFALRLDFGSDPQRAPAFVAGMPGRLTIAELAAGCRGTQRVDLHGWHPDQPLDAFVPLAVGADQGGSLRSMQLDFAMTWASKLVPQGTFALATVLDELGTPLRPSLCFGTLARYLGVSPTENGRPTCSPAWACWDGSPLLFNLGATAGHAPLVLFVPEKIVVECDRLCLTGIRRTARRPPPANPGAAPVASNNEVLDGVAAGATIRASLVAWRDRSPIEFDWTLARCGPRCRASDCRCGEKY